MVDMSGQARIELLEIVRELCKELDRVVEAARCSGAPSHTVCLIEQAQAELLIRLNKRKPTLN